MLKSHPKPPLLWNRFVPSVCSPEVWHPNRYRSHTEEQSIFWMESSWRPFIFYYIEIFLWLWWYISNGVGTYSLFCLQNKKCVRTYHICMVSVLARHIVRRQSMFSMNAKQPILLKSRSRSEMIFNFNKNITPTWSLNQFLTYLLIRRL